MFLFWRHWLTYTQRHPNTAQACKHTLFNPTFRFLVSAFCHCVVKLQHQLFTPYKDKSSNTPVSACLLALCCIVFWIWTHGRLLFFEGAGGSGGKWTYLPTARSSSVENNCKGRGKQLGTNASPVQMSNTEPFVFYLGKIAQLSGYMAYKRAACFPQVVKTMVHDKNITVFNKAELHMPFWLASNWFEMEQRRSFFILHC